MSSLRSVAIPLRFLQCIVVYIDPSSDWRCLMRNFKSTIFFSEHLDTHRKWRDHSIQPYVGRRVDIWPNNNLQKCNWKNVLKSQPYFIHKQNQLRIRDVDLYQNKQMHMRCDNTGMQTNWLSFDGKSIICIPTTMASHAQIYKYVKTNWRWQSPRPQISWTELRNNAAITQKHTINQ